MVLPPVGPRTCGLGARLGWPLNQKSAPAASLAPDTAPPAPAGSGTNSAGGVVPFGAKRTLWNPTILNETLSPARTAIRLG